MSKTKIYFFIIICLSISYNVFSQKLRNEDYVYHDFIRTVKMIPVNPKTRISNSSSSKGQKTTTFVSTSEFELIPMIQLNIPNDVMTFNFDDMRGDKRRFRYKVELCNADWTTSSLGDLEYVEGFAESNFLEDGEFSAVVSTKYTNYQFTFPNNETKLKLSGNYMLHIFEDSGDRMPILSRRFIVFEQSVNVTSKFTTTGKPANTLTHHELDFDLESKFFPVSNPKREIKATVLQNGRWDIAKDNLQPVYIRDGIFTFDYFDSIVFPAGKEFLQFDIRSLNNRGISVDQIDLRKGDDIRVELRPDYVKPSKASFATYDMNGNFIIDNLDMNGEYTAQQGNLQGFASLFNNKSTTTGAAPTLKLIDARSKTRSEYANVLFSLKTNAPFENADVYVMGKIFDWQCYEKNKMVYDEDTHTYYAEIPLKQGFYDYTYAVVPQNRKKEPYEMSDIEGDTYETENIYTVIVYYRPQGGRYDRVVGFGFLNSASNR